MSSETCNGYCVCHTSISSRAWCPCCKGDNGPGRVPRCAAPDPSNASGYCARALPCGVHEPVFCIAGVPLVLDFRGVHHAAPSAPQGETPRDER